MIIKNGRVIDPKSGFDGIADIIIKDGKIKKILKKAEASEVQEALPETGEEVIDASGLIVAPGLIASTCISGIRALPIRRTSRRGPPRPRQAVLPQL